MHKERQRHGDLEPTKPATGALDESELAELARLRREVQELRIDNGVLRKLRTRLTDPGSPSTH